MDDQKFNRMFLQEIQRDIRRMRSDRRENEEGVLNKGITLKEVIWGCKKNKQSKAEGDDQVITEWLKFGGDRMKFALLKMFRMFWDLEMVPKAWNCRGVISAIFKDGDKRDPLNYRGVTLLSVVGKTFTSILNERILRWSENEILEDEQGGFRKGRGCVEQIFVLKEMLYLRKGKKTFCCFIDVKKAYDRVWRWPVD